MLQSLPLEYALDPDQARGQEVCGLSGKALWATHLVWSEILRSWCELRDRGSLPVIPFDKMCLLTGLVWNHLKDQKIVQWAVPYMPAPGEHGHGPKLYTAAEKKRRPFVVDFLKMEFLIFPALARNVFGLMPPPDKEESRITKVKSTLEPEAIGGHTGKDGVLTEKEGQLVGELSKIIGVLSADEIRVLGVHSGVERTIEAIEYNASFWYRLATEIVAKMVEKRSPQGEMLDKISQLTKELQRKAGLQREGTRSGRTQRRPLGNQQIYVAARQKVANATQVDKRVREAFLYICPNPSDIWGEGLGVIDWQPIVRELAMFTGYWDGLDAKATEVNHPERRIPPRDMRRMRVGEEARANLVALGYTLHTYEDVFSGQKKTEAGCLGDALREFLGKIPKVRYPEHWEGLLPTMGSA